MKNIHEYNEYNAAHYWPYQNLEGAESRPTKSWGGGGVERGQGWGLLETFRPPWYYYKQGYTNLLNVMETVVGRLHSEGHAPWCERPEASVLLPG